MTPGDLLETLPVPDELAGFARAENRWRVHYMIDRLIRTHPVITPQANDEDPVLAPREFRT